MANFEFGIGITVDPASINDASKAVGQFIGNIENSLASWGDIDLSQIWGSFDPTLLMPDNEAIADAAASLREIKGILAGITGSGGDIAEDLQEVAGASTDAADELQEVADTACGITKCVGGVKEGLQEVSGATQGWLAGLKEVPGLMDDAGKQAGKIQAASDLITENVSQLEFISVRTEAAIGGTRAEIEAFGKSAYDTANRTGVAWQQVAALQVGLRDVAVEFDSATAAGQRQIDAMVMLNEVFELTPQQVASLAGTMKATGNNLEDLTGVAADFQKKFKVPGLINQLPAVAKGAMKAQGEFGSLVGKSSRDIMVNVTKMAGTYSRALGVTAAEGAQKAMATFTAFTKEIENYEDLFLGLADDFSPLQTAFLETGIGLEDLQDLMKKGQEDPAAYAEEVKRIRDSMDPQMGERFFRQVLRNSDEATRALLTQEAAAKEAGDAMAGAGQEPEDPSAVFDNMAKAMRESAGDALKQKQALEETGKEMLRFAASEGVRDGIKKINDVIRGTNTLLSEGIDKLNSNSEARERFRKVTADTTTVIAGLNTAIGAFQGLMGGAGTMIGGVGAALGFLWRPIGFIIDKLGLFKGATGTAAGAATKGGGIFKGFSKILGKLAFPIGVAIAAFDNIAEAVGNVGKILSDPNATGMEKFKSIVGEVLGAIWGTFDDFFLGLPGKFVEGFMGAGKAVSTEGAASFGESVGEFLKGGIGVLLDFFTITVPDMLGKWWDATYQWFASRSWQEILLDPLIAVVGGFKAIGDQIFAFFGGVFKGLGGDLDVLKASFGLIWAGISEAFMLGLVDPIMDAWITLKGLLKIGVASIYDLFGLNFDGIALLFLNMAKSVNETFNKLIGGITGPLKTMAEAIGWDGMADKLGAVDAALAGSVDNIDAMIEKTKIAGQASASRAAQAQQELDDERKARAENVAKRKEELDIARQHLEAAASEAAERKRLAQIEADRKAAGATVGATAGATPPPTGPNARTTTATTPGEPTAPPAPTTTGTTREVTAPQPPAVAAPTGGTTPTTTPPTMPTATPGQVSERAQPSPAAAVFGALGGAAGAAGGGHIDIFLKPNSEWLDIEVQRHDMWLGNQSAIDIIEKPGG